MDYKKKYIKYKLKYLKLKKEINNVNSSNNSEILFDTITERNTYFNENTKIFDI